MLPDSLCKRFADHIRTVVRLHTQPFTLPCSACTHIMQNHGLAHILCGEQLPKEQQQQPQLMVAVLYVHSVSYSNQTGVLCCHSRAMSCHCFQHPHQSLNPGWLQQSSWLGSLPSGMSTLDVPGESVALKTDRIMVPYRPEPSKAASLRWDPWCLFRQSTV